MQNLARAYELCKEFAESSTAVESSPDLSTVITNKVEFRYAPLPDEEEEGGLDGDVNNEKDGNEKGNGFDNYEYDLNEYRIASESEEEDSDGITIQIT